MRLDELREELAEEQRRKEEEEKNRKPALSDITPHFSYAYGDEGRIEKRWSDGRIEVMLPYPYDFSDSYYR